MLSHARASLLVMSTPAKKPHREAPKPLGADVVAIKQISPMLNSLSGMYPNLAMWDISDITCPTKKCVPVSNSMQYLRDTNHLYTSSLNLQNLITNDLNLLLKQ